MSSKSNVNSQDGDGDVVIVDNDNDDNDDDSFCDHEEPATPRSSTKATRKNALFFLILSKPNLHCFLRLFEKLVFGIYIMNTYN